MLRPEDIWPVDDEYAGLYGYKVAEGRRIAADTSATIVAIARNAAHALPNTMSLLAEVQEGFEVCKAFVFENDSTDQTAQFLDDFASHERWLTVEHDAWGGIDSRGFERERTERLAKARNRCLDWARMNARNTSWTIVIDLDPEHGFSVNGVFNSVAWLADKESECSPRRAGAMASYSLYRVTDEKGGVGVAQYDSWAARLNWWRDRRNEVGGMAWFSTLLPPVGSPPVPMNSAFGGLCVYRTEAYLSSHYSGEDCEHVPFHRRMHAAGWQLYLNPGCRYVAIYR